MTCPLCHRRCGNGHACSTVPPRRRRETFGLADGSSIEVRSGGKGGELRSVAGGGRIEFLADDGTLVSIEGEGK
jgi:hypothetical protein